jgi:PAS domain S-box-containing protein
MSKSDPGLRKVTPAVWRYGLSVLLVASSTALTFPVQDFGVRTSLFFPAILLATWFGGTGPGLLAVLLSTLSINFFFTEPFFTFQFSVRDIPTTIAFLFSALVLSSWSSARKHSESRLRESESELRKARNELEVKVAERTASLSRANEELQTEIVERKRAEEKLRRSEGFLAEGQRISHTGSWSWKVSTGQVTWSEEHFRIFGFDPETTTSSFQLFLETVHPDDRSFIQRSLDEAIEEKRGFDLEFRIALKDGSIKQVQGVGRAILGESGNVDGYIGTTVDITARKRGEALFAGEKRLLEMIATGVPLREILNALCLIIEDYRPNTLASILLLRADSIHLDSVAGPSLPAGWRKEMEKLPIGPCAGSCGTAAYRGSAVIVSDIATDPLWEVPEHRAAALNHGLRASWSNPILSSEKKVLGTFCIYERQTKSPSAHDLELIEKATYLARVAIERDRAEMDLRTSEAYLAEAQRLSHTGSWAWSPATGQIRYWSEETYRVLGFDPDAGPPRFEKFFGRLHPDDQNRVRELFGKAIAQNAEFETDYRVVHPNGDVKDIHAVGHPVCDEAGHLVEFVGTVIDITENKNSETALRASEQVARGQVEALAQSLDVLATAPDPEKFIGQMLSTIGRLLNTRNVTLWLFDESNDTLILRFSTPDGAKLKEDSEHPFIKDPSYWKQVPIVQELLFTAGPIVCDNIETDPRVTGEWAEHLKHTDTRRFLAVPLLVGGQVRGFIGIRHTDTASYRPEEIELTQALAHQVMLALQLNEFAEQSQRAAVFEERNRMARDIHDTLAQGFTGVIVQLEAAEDAMVCGSRKEADKHLHRAGELARRSLSEARRSVHALRPQALWEHNFWDALKGTIKNTTAGTALHTTFEARGKLPELPQLWQENLLHIGQEALSNTLKYARAHNFKARLTYNAKELRLELRDDGDGFKVKDRHDGVGLTGMRERVEQMGGALEITSSRGKGTTISVSLPCNGESIS